MVRVPVFARTVLLGAVLGLCPAAGAEVGFSWSFVARNVQMDHADYESSLSGVQYRLDFGPSSWAVRPEAGFTGTSGGLLGLFSDDGQREYELGLAWRGRQDDVGLRLSGGVSEIKTFTSTRDLRVRGAYLDLALVWYAGERFSLGLAVRGWEGEDAFVAGRQLGTDYRQAGVVVGWRFGD